MSSQRKAILSDGILSFVTTLLILPSGIFQSDLFLQQFLRPFRTGRIEGIMNLFPIFTPLHNVGIAQYLHMMGKRRLCNMQIIQQLTGTFLTRPELFQYSQTVFIAECFKNFYGFAIRRCHFVSPRIQSFELIS